MLRRIVRPSSGGLEGDGAGVGGRLVYGLILRTVNVIWQKGLQM